MVSLSVLLFAAGTLLQEALQLYSNNTLKDHPEAVNALRDAAEDGNTDAAFLLATSYRNGKTGTKDNDRAMKWYKKAADEGDADAMLMLGWLYYKGSVTMPSNVGRAKVWFEKAAARGIDEAVEMLEILKEI